MPNDHKPITEEELKEWEQEMEPWGMLSEGPDIEGVIKRLISEVRGLREALGTYGELSSWVDMFAHGIEYHAFTPARQDARNAPGYKLARLALGWEYPPPEPCPNPSCDGIKDDKTYNDAHRCFKDGRWLDDGSEM